MTSTGWHPADQMADRLQRPPPSDADPGWRQSLAVGAPGTALLHIERAHAGHGRWETAHTWVAAATRAPITANPTSSLFLGAPAVAFAVHAAGLPGYQAALRTLDDHITELTHRRLRQAHARIDRGDLPRLGEYDLIKGLTGLGAYLLHRYGDNLAVRYVLGYLVRLTEPLQVDGETLPGWWTSHGLADRASEHFPGGHGNLGMAHGITGPLALLATAKKRGIAVDGHTDAIECISAWMDTWRHDDSTGPWWLPWVARNEQRLGRPIQTAPRRPSWCYGTPGHARAQQLAAQATGDIRRQRLAEEALLACVTDEHQLALLTNTSLCHGWAGLLHTAWRAANDAHTSDLAVQIPRLRERLIQRMGASSSEPGFLEGQAGSVLALHTTTISRSPASCWDACLLTNG